MTEANNPMKEEAIVRGILEKLTGARLVGLEKTNPGAGMVLIFENLDGGRCELIFTAFFQATTNEKGLSAIPAASCNLTPWRK